MALTRLLPLLASLQMLPRPVSPADPDPAPRLTVSPTQPVYITGETVTLTCSGTRTSSMSGVRFFRDSQEIHSQEQPSPGSSYSIQLPGVFGLRTGAYSCDYWETESGPENPSERSQAQSILVTDIPAPPTLSLSRPYQLYLTGESVVFTCSAPPGDHTVTGFQFSRVSGETISSGNSDTHTLSSVTQRDTGSYTCVYWVEMSGHRLKSGASPAVPISVTDPPPAPTLSLDAGYTVYLPGERVKLTCSAPGGELASGYRFFYQGQQDPGTVQYPSQGARLELTVGKGDAGSYTCVYRRQESSREIWSRNSSSVSITVPDPDPAPRLTVSPTQPVYITGETVTLTCLATTTSTVSRVRFFRDSQEIHSKKQPSPGYSYSELIRQSGVSGLRAGAYRCEYWTRGWWWREIPSERSQTISIRVTAPDPAPRLTMSPTPPVYITGETVTMTCTATTTSTVSGVRFFRDNQEIHSQEQPSPGYSYSESIRQSGMSGLRAGAYSCESWRRESGREIPSERSQTISIRVTDPPPAPTLALDPEYTVYLPGEQVNLTCLAPRGKKALGYRFFYQKWPQDPNIIQQPSEGARLELTVGKGDAGSYTCVYWRRESSREISSGNSNSVSIPVTDLPPQPALSVGRPPGAESEGIPLLITCTAPRDASQRRFHFFKDGVELVPGDVGSEINRTEPRTGSMNTSVLRIPLASPNNTGEFTCEYEENVNGSWISSPRSQAVTVTGNIPVSAHRFLWLRELVVGGSFFLTNGLIFLVSHCCF